MGKKKKYRVVKIGKLKLRYSKKILNHILKHNVTLSEVVTVLEGKVYRRKLKRDTWMFIGKTTSGRFLTVFLEKKGANVFRLKTARDSTYSEKKLYRKLSK